MKHAWQNVFDTTSVSTEEKDSAQIQKIRKTSIKQGKKRKGTIRILESGPQRCNIQKLFSEYLIYIITLRNG